MTLTRFFAAAALALLASTSVACSAASDDPSSESEEDLSSRYRFTSLRAPTDADLKAVHTAGKNFEYGYLGVYRFNKAGPEATDPVARQNRVKEVMHRYMCTFFDEEIDVTRQTGPKRIDATLEDLDMINNGGDDDEAKVTQLSSALGRVYADANMDVMSGYAYGNNTAGNVLGVYDMKHNEILFFGFTNCGSDD